MALRVIATGYIALYAEPWIKRSREKLYPVSDASVQARTPSDPKLAELEHPLIVEVEAALLLRNRPPERLPRAVPVFRPPCRARKLPSFLSSPR